MSRIVSLSWAEFINQITKCLVTEGYMGVRMRVENVLNGGGVRSEVEYLRLKGKSSNPRPTFRNQGWGTRRQPFLTHELRMCAAAVQVGRVGRDGSCWEGRCAFLT